MVDLHFQEVRGLLSNLFTRFLTPHDWFGLQPVCYFLPNILSRFLTPKRLSHTLRMCVISSRIYWLGFWPWHVQFGLSACAWFAFGSAYSISDPNKVDLDSRFQIVRGFLSSLFTRFLTWNLSMRMFCSRIHTISDNDMVGLDSQIVRGFLSNLLTGFQTLTWLIWTLRL